MYIKKALVLVLVIIDMANTCIGGTTIYKYRMYCNTEGANVYRWSESAPTACPNNTNHSINANSISVVDERADDVVKIKEEDIATGGHICIETQTINVATGPDVDTVVSKSWPFPISVLAISFSTNSENEGDVLRLEAPYQKVFGYITQDVALNDTVIKVSQTVIDNIAVGFHVMLDNGTATNDLGRVIAVDTVNAQITLETAATDIFLAATPTYVKVTVRQWNDFEVGPAWQYDVGMAKLGGSNLPANIAARMTYTNKTAQAKKIVVDYEYLY